MKKLILSILLQLIAGVFVFAQNGIIGSGFGTNDWSTTNGFGGSNGGSRIGVFNANGTGNQYFRLVTSWDGNYDQYGPESTTNDYQITPGTAVPASELKQYSTTKAYFLNVTSTSHKYIFKTKAGGNPPPNIGLIVFKIEGDIRTVSGSVRNHETVYRGHEVVVTSTLNNAFNAGQGIYLRYTTNNYASSTVVPMTGSGTTYTATIPASVNTSGAAVNYYIFTSGSGLTISGSDVDWYTINVDNNSGSNYYYTVNGAYLTKADGNWSNAEVWVDGVPGSGATVVIANDVTLDQDVTVASLTVNAGKTFTASDGTTRTLTLPAEGSITNNGTFNHGSGKLNLQGAAYLTGTIALNDVDIAGAANFGAASTIEGTLQIKSGGYVNINAPVYAAGSTLQYNSGGNYGRSTEWTTTSGKAYPHHVKISNNTSFFMPYAGNGLLGQCAGNLTIDEGSVFNMNQGSQYMTKELIVKGNLINNGTLTLSNAVGGDLKSEGNFSNNGTFNVNGRAVFFNGSAHQQVSGNATTISYIRMDKNNAQLTLNAGIETIDLEVTNGTLNVAAGKSLTITDRLFNNDTIILKSDATGTATMLTPATIAQNGVVQVNQYLTNGRNWYLSAPVSNATTTMLSSATSIAFWDEPIGNWFTFSEESPLAVGRGYISVNTWSPGNITFTGDLNNSNLSIPLTKTAGKYKEGFNLIGNPYASYLDWKKIYDYTADEGVSYPNRVMPTSSMWYRTRVTEGENTYYDFWTVNGASGLGTPEEASRYIPPMQGFWVRSNQASANLTVANAMRSHAPESSKLLKMPAEPFPLVRLQLNSDTGSDETLLYFTENASFGFDAYDSEKMFSDTSLLPSVFTRAGNEALAINGMNAYYPDLQLPLSIVVRNAGNYSLSTRKISGIDNDIRLVLLDNQTMQQTDLTSGGGYTFNATAGTSDDRFVLLFKSATGTTQTDWQSAGSVYVSASDNRIILHLNSNISDARVTVFNAVGQPLKTQQIVNHITTLEGDYGMGVYLLKVENGGRTAVLRTVVN